MQNISITSITNIKKLVIHPRLLESVGHNVTPLSYPATQTLLPSHFKPQLSNIPIKAHTHHFIACICIKYGKAISVFYIISVEWVMILLLPIYTFLHMNWLQAQIFKFDARYKTCNRTTLQEVKPFKKILQKFKYKNTKLTYFKKKKS